MSTFKRRRNPAVLAAFFLFSVCVSIVLIEGWRIWRARDAQIAESKVAASNLSRSLAEHAAGALLQTDVLVADVVERLENDGVQPRTLERIRLIAQSTKVELEQLHRLSVIDENGHRLISDPDLSDRDMAPTDREYFRFHRDHAASSPHLGPPIPDGADDSWFITVSRRFNHGDGSFAGVVVASIDLRFFSDYYNEFDIGEDGSIVLAMRDGTILERRPYKADLIGTSIGNRRLFTEHIAYDDSGTARIKSAIDGTERISAFYKLHSFPVYAIVSHAERSVLQAWVGDSIVHGTAALVLLCFLCVVGVELVGQINRRSADQERLMESEAELIRLNAKLEVLAREDGLTQLPNRRTFDAALASEVQRSAQTGMPLTLIMLDIDRFKLFNDRYGHQQGDDCLRRVAAELRRLVTRPGDLAARYGGEEFVVLLPATTSAGARAVAERIRQALHACAIPHEAGTTRFVTASYGIAAVAEGDEQDVDLVARADAALYRAKARGRDGICMDQDWAGASSAPAKLAAVR